MKASNLERTKKVAKVVLICASVFIIGYTVQALVISASEPGTDSDPIVSKSYVDLADNKFKEELNSVKSDVKKTKFEVVEINKGQKLIAGEGTEFILRAGKASAISSESGGIADFTADKYKDYFNEEILPINHLMLVSRDDGRGVLAIDDKVYLMVKGQYVIKE